MDEASPTARGRPARAATSTPVAVLLALVTALVTAVAVLGTPARHSPADPAPTRTSLSVAAVAHAHDTTPFADDACATTCTSRARAHRDPLGERTTPPGQVVTLPRGTTATPAQPLRAPPSSEQPPPLAEHTTHDRGRAPPTPSST
ncbi:hypothetical protein NGF19_28670 [Streptomyces sp. RY43-2]|uniref:Uncharacterized protein n=1 Tax=Streptomyces macrolidinus TaxID=2952607 RepID=A0ABT0ZM86_9ACTN|nr:hypothetical protein [Streptomyces macrolidinus]MCN9244707.1 hypothetical protein [Streptomyces macrolidinus]